MVPGMAHCGGGPGPNQFNALAAIERWRELGTAPDQMVASRVTNNRVDMTRPLCPTAVIVPPIQRNIESGYSSWMTQEQGKAIKPVGIRGWRVVRLPQQ